jgi:hypothetical protein
LAGFLKAFQVGDATGVRAAADFFRERGDEANGHALDVLAFEVECECVLARQVRFVLDRMGPVKPASGQRLDVVDYAESIGLPVLVKGSRSPFVILVPNDGQHADTVHRLERVLGARFPEEEFFVILRNQTITDLASKAYKVLDAEGGE